MPATVPTSPITGGPVLSPSILSYLQSIGLDDKALAKLIDAAAGGLLGAVPPAGEYITSLDYETLYPVLAEQYVSEVIQSYEAQLGPVPELYDAAVAAGYLTEEQAAAMAALAESTTGTLQEQFARQGGLRALAGPYMAERTKLLAAAQADIQSAAQKASSDAYKMANDTTNSRINALQGAGNMGVALAGHGVARRNAEGMEGPGGEEMQMPLPPKPDEPGIWERVLPGLITAAGTAGLAYLTRPRTDSPEEAARKRYEFEQETKRLNAPPESAEERGPLNDESWLARQEAGPSLSPSEWPDAEIAATSYRGGPQAMANGQGYGGAWEMNPYQEPAAPSYSWQAPLQTPNRQGYGGAWEQPSYDTGGYDYGAYDPGYSYGGSYGGGGEYYGGGTSYGYDASNDYYGGGYYDYPTYDASSWSYDTSGGYWV